MYKLNITQNRDLIKDYNYKEMRMEFFPQPKVKVTVDLECVFDTRIPLEKKLYHELVSILTEINQTFRGPDDTETT